MKVFFRVDASEQMGTGHVMRCLALADALHSKGIETRFICREHPGNLIWLLRQRAFPVTVLPAATFHGASQEENYADWLGATESDDSAQTVEALNGEMPDWLIVDHYGLGIEWEQTLRPHIRKLMVIDDLANRHHDCDVLLDQNYSPEGRRRYAELLVPKCKTLVGPNYALLRPEYAAYRKTLRPRNSGDIRRVLVFFGGSDPSNMTGLTLDVLSHSECSEFEVDVVIGANNPHREMLIKKAEGRPRTTVYGQRSHLADLMAAADLAFGAGGATTWERACLKLPAIVISIAENQRPACEALAKAKLVHYAGHFSEVREESLVQLIRQINDGVDGRASHNFYVDGLGTMRVVETLFPSDVSDVRLRPACGEENSPPPEWAIDGRCEQRKVKEAFTSLGVLSAFSEEAAGAHFNSYTVETSGLPIGAIHIQKNANDASIDYSVDEVIGDRGWEASLVALGMDMSQRSEPVTLSRGSEVKNNDGHALFYRLCNSKVELTSQVRTQFSIVIISDKTTWLNDHIPRLLLELLLAGHRVLWVHDQNDLRPADFCFYLSYGRIVSASTLSQYRHNLVVHESDLPKGKGWSPLTWQILEGKNLIPITLLEAEEEVDSGVIYAQDCLQFEGHELLDEMHERQAGATLRLVHRFLTEYPQIVSDARTQVGEPSVYPRRRPQDSEIDCGQAIDVQFNLLRTVDNFRYPAFFDNRGYRYQIKIEKVKVL